MEKNNNSGTEGRITIRKFIKAIKRLPSDEPKVTKGKWYTSQKQHWLGWLGEYEGPGAYGRKNWNRDAKFAYNHVVCPELLMYLIHAIPLKNELLDHAEIAYKTGNTEMEKSGAIRKVVRWEDISLALWPNQDPSFVDKIRSLLFHKER